MTASAIISWISRTAFPLITRRLPASPNPPMIRSASSKVVITVATGAFGVVLTMGAPLFAAGSSDPAGADSGSVWRSAEPTPPNPAISVAGTVLDSETGEPIAGADVILRAKIRNQQYAFGLSHPRDMLARAKTDSAGRFALDKIGIPPRAIEMLGALRQGTGGAQLVVYSPGKALKWMELTSFTNPPTEFRLEDQADVSGVVVDEQDRPVGMAELTLRAIYAGTTELDSSAKDPADLNLLSELRFQVTADEQGGFKIPHLPRDCRAMVGCVGPAGQGGHFMIDTGDHHFASITFRNGARRNHPVHRTPIRFQAEQQAWVEIRVTDHDGKPVDSGGIVAIKDGRQYGGQADVDQHGMALLLAINPGMHELHYAADPLVPRVRAKLNVDIQAEDQPVVEIQLPRPIIVSGKVVDADTGHPIAGAYIQSAALTVSGVDGTFRLPTTPGQHSLSLRHEIDGYHVASVFGRESPGLQPDLISVNVSEDGTSDEVVFRISRGLAIRGVVRAGDGRPASGVTVTAKNQDSPFRAVAGVSDDNGEFELSGLSPHVDTRVCAVTESGAAEIMIPAQLDQPWDQTLTRTVELAIEPGVTLTGRVVRDGVPVPDVTMKLHKSPPPNPGKTATRYMVFSETKTDAEGRYWISGLKPGERYRFEVIAPGNLQVRDWPHQSPYLQSVKAMDGETVVLPDAELVSSGQQLSGIVVDPTGNAIPDVQVSARLTSGRTLARPLRGPPPWARTDSNGRFTIANLPDEPVRLMAHRSNPGGGIIQYPAYALPPLNAQDIRIVLDTRLGSEIEDLDAD